MTLRRSGVVNIAAVVSTLALAAARSAFSGGVCGAAMVAAIFSGFSDHAFACVACAWVIDCHA